MEIHEVLRFFRKKLQFTQKEILPDLDPSVYSRLEGGKQEIKLNDLKQIMNSLSLSQEEIFFNAPLDSEQRKYLTLFYYCSQNLHNLKKKQELLLYYEEIKNKSKNLRELSNYIAIKSYFSQLWEEVDRLTNEEINTTYTMLVNKKYFQHYDYSIIRNLIRFFDKKQIDVLMMKIFPLKQQSPEMPFRSSLVYHIILNVITARLYDKDFEDAKKYVTLAKKQYKKRDDLFFRLNLKYLENLLNYLSTGDYQYMHRIQEYINLLEDVGDTELANHIQKEIKLTVHDIIVNTRESKLAITLLRES